MSAYIVSHATIAAIVTFAQRRLWFRVPPPPHNGRGAVNIRDIDPDEIGQALLVENVRSVNHRYGRKNPVARHRHVPTCVGAVSTEVTRTLTAMDVMNYAEPAIMRSARQQAPVCRALSHSGLSIICGLQCSAWPCVCLAP